MGMEECLKVKHILTIFIRDRHIIIRDSKYRYNYTYNLYRLLIVIHRYCDIVKLKLQSFCFSEEEKTKRNPKEKQIIIYFLKEKYRYIIV